MLSKRRLTAIMVLIAATLACNTLFPDLPQNTVPDAVRKDGECTDQRFKDAELAAYQTMLQERAAATAAFDQKITEIETTYKEGLEKKRADYNKQLKDCKDAACSQGAQADYDKYVNIEQVVHEGAIHVAEDKEQREIEQAQDKYNAAVEEARKKYCVRTYRASGADGPVVYSGVICSLEQPFTVVGTHSLLGTMNLEFTPSSEVAGAMSYGGTSGLIQYSGSGSYTVAGPETDTPRIVLQVSSTASIPQTSDAGSGMADIILTPLDKQECK